MSLANDVKMSRKTGHFLENIILGHFGALLGVVLPTTHSSKKKGHGCVVKVNSYQFGYNKFHAIVT